MKTSTEVVATTKRASNVTTTADKKVAGRKKLTKSDYIRKFLATTDKVGDVIKMVSKKGFTVYHSEVYRVQNSLSNSEIA